MSNEYLKYSKLTFSLKEVVDIIDKEIEKYNPDEQLGIHDRYILIELRKQFMANK